MSGEEHPAREACEDVAEDLGELWSEAERLKRKVEERLQGLARGKVALGSWAEKLTALRDSLERTLADVDAKTDEMAGRFPRGPERESKGHNWS